MNIQEIKESKEPVLVDFYSQQCPPCRAMLPIIGEIEAEGHKVAKLDVYENMDFASELGVSAVPAFFIFRDGKVVHRCVGLQKKVDLLKHMEG